MRPSMLKSLKHIWLLTGVVLLFFLIVEAAFSLAFLAKDRLIKPDDFIVSSDTYDDRSWLADYLRETHLSARTRWSPYVYWRRQPFAGTYINVDDAGLRRTFPGPPDDAQGPAPKIFLFGGSTMWGTG